MENKITHDPVSKRFEMEIEDRKAYIRYRSFDGGIEILTTQVPSELEGRGIASALTKETLEYARSQRLRVIPSCSFTSAYIRRHPEYRDLKI